MYYGRVSHAYYTLTLRLILCLLQIKSRHTLLKYSCTQLSVLMILTAVARGGSCLTSRYVAGWLTPLLHRVRHTNTTVPMPVIDSIDELMLEMTPVGDDNNVYPIGVFDWKLVFQWLSPDSPDMPKRTVGADQPMR